MDDKTINPSVKVRKFQPIDKNKANWLRLLAHLIGLIPLAILAFKGLTDDLTVNPIQFVEQYLGRNALNMLIIVLAVTPLVTITDWKRLIPHRRTLGLYAFFYFLLHFLTFVFLDYGLNLQEIFRLMIEKPFIIVGTLAGLILLILAATSNKYAIIRLGKKWKNLHKLVYLAGLLAVLHYVLAVKGSLTTLSGNILRPIIMGLLVLLLLILRIPVVKRWIFSLRQKIRSI